MRPSFQGWVSSLAREKDTKVSLQDSLLADASGIGARRLFQMMYLYQQ